MERPKMSQEMYKWIITKNIANLTEYIQYRDISAMLVQEEVITQQEDMEITGGDHTTNVRMMRQFLNILLQKMLERVYYKFKEVLKHYACHMALQYLDKTEQQIKNGNINYALIFFYTQPIYSQLNYSRPPPPHIKLFQYSLPLRLNYTEPPPTIKLFFHTQSNYSFYLYHVLLAVMTTKKMQCRIYMYICM